MVTDFFGYQRNKRHLTVALWALLCASVVACFAPSPVRAQTTKTDANAPIPTSVMAEIRSQPLSLLAKFPEGGPAMAQFVARAVSQDPSLATPMLSVAKDSSPRQAAAMGAGLVRSARALAATKPEASRAIANQVMKSDNLRVKVIFQAMGPSISAYDALTISATIPPKPPNTNPVGSALPQDIGNNFFLNDPPSINPQDIAQRVVEVRTNNTDNYPAGTSNNEALFTPTMLGVIVSDAVSNGAVSTSPTE